MRDHDQEYDVAESEPAHEEHSLPQRIRTEGIWRHLPARTEAETYASAADAAAGDPTTTDDPTTDEEKALEDQAPPDAEAVPVADEGPAERRAEIGRLVVAGDRPALADVKGDA